eukprot:CAMPEP_0194398290 /NCGR_PEP_ID=MMETSP0174-20130528/126021_1 /TAXON_ID=216777 /ORGANISM="Proboscia alata, Strain PI-D3" /LENGTH=705 /DNA_ID=CAMNT_0039194569 /DNA_START=144 /DNA_END=2261 /DNA_ORIENTATION=-
MYSLYLQQHNKGNEEIFSGFNSFENEKNDRHRRCLWHYQNNNSKRYPNTTVAFPKNSFILLLVILGSGGGISSFVLPPLSRAYHAATKQQHLFHQLPTVSSIAPVSKSKTFQPLNGRTKQQQLFSSSLENDSTSTTTTLQKNERDQLLNEQYRSKALASQIYKLLQPPRKNSDKIKKKKEMEAHCLLLEMIDIRTNTTALFSSSSKSPAIKFRSDGLTKRLFTTVMKSWANCARAYHRSGEMAHVLLEHMREVSKYDNSLKPDTVCYGIVLDAHAKQCNFEAAQTAESLLNDMLNCNIGVQPNTICYNAVIEAWASSSSSGASRKQKGDDTNARRAEKILMQMQRRYEQQQQLNNSTESGGTSNIGNIGVVQPDTYSYTTVIHAWSQSGVIGSAERCYKILKQMHKVSKSSDPSKRNSNAQPNTITYNAVMNAYARDPHTGSVTLTEGGEKGGKGEDTSNSDSSTATTKPSKKDSKQQSLTIIMPTGKAEKAYQLLCEMEYQKARGNANLSPTLVSYSTVLNACVQSHTSGRSRRKAAFEIAVKVFEKLEKFGEETYLSERGLNESSLDDSDKKEKTGGNHITYALFLKTCEKLLSHNSKERYEYSTTCFHNACENGMVDKAVLEAFERATTPNLWKTEVLRKRVQLKKIPANVAREEIQKKSHGKNSSSKGGRGDMSKTQKILEQLPKEWSANVVNTRKQRKRR